MRITLSVQSETKSVPVRRRLHRNVWTWPTLGLENAVFWSKLKWKLSNFPNPTETVLTQPNNCLGLYTIIRRMIPCKPQEMFNVHTMVIHANGMFPDQPILTELDMWFHQKLQLFIDIVSGLYKCKHCRAYQDDWSWKPRMSNGSSSGNRNWRPILQTRSHICFNLIGSLAIALLRCMVRMKVLWGKMWQQNSSI